MNAYSARMFEAPEKRELAVDERVQLEVLLDAEREVDTAAHDSPITSGDVQAT